MHLDSLTYISPYIPIIFFALFINKVVYDFVSVYKLDKRPDISGKLMAITYVTNADRIRDLVPLLGIDMSRELAIVSYSSYKGIAIKVEKDVRENIHDKIPVHTYIAFGKSYQCTAICKTF